MYKLLWARHRVWLRPLLLLLASLAVLGVAVLLWFYLLLAGGLPDLDPLENYTPPETSKIYAADGQLIATLYEENRTYVELDQIAPQMVKAIVAVEDARFFEHEGVDVWGVVRAAWSNLESQEVQQGASTITMQLTRHLFLDDERTLKRKLREAMLARRLERRFSKEKILELYLNEVYFGAGAYGIDAAASLYFGTSPARLTVAQSAMLAGVVQAPSSLSPLVDPEAARERQLQVLERMKDTQEITLAQYGEAVAQARAMKFESREPVVEGMLKYPYFSTYVIRQLSNLFSEKMLRRGGLKIYTTLDVEAQQHAETTLGHLIASEGPAYGADNGALVLLDNEGGQIRAMVGGKGWSEKDRFNRAWQARRQPGSAFKMFVYAAALETGFTPEHEFPDTESTFGDYVPKNSDGRFFGSIPMRTALQYSRNVVALKVMAHVGPPTVMSLARRMGVESDLPGVLALALGAAEVTPLEMAAAYSVLPQGGVLHPPQAITLVQDADGKVLKDFRQAAGRRALQGEVAAQMCEMLERVVLAGTGTEAHLGAVYTAGKTGTTDSYKDAWFVGFTPHYTAAVWMGRDDNKPMWQAYGGGLPARIWRLVLQPLEAERNPSDPLPGVTFGKPEGFTLCADSTYLARPGCPRTYQDAFRTGVVPTRKCPVHLVVKVEPEGDVPVLTNLATPSVTETEDVRDHPLVVTPAGAVIPYTEKEPAGPKIKVVAPTPTPTPEETPEVEVEVDQTPELLEEEEPLGDSADPEVPEVPLEELEEPGYPTADEEPEPAPSASPEEALPPEPAPLEESPAPGDGI